jgi:hypothetical protein
MTVTSVKIFRKYSYSNVNYAKKFYDIDTFATVVNYTTIGVI